MRMASLTWKVWSFALLSTVAGFAVAQADHELEAEDAAWLGKQPAATQRYFRAKARDWKACSVKFAQRSPKTEAASVAKSVAPKMYRITSGGVVVQSTLRGVCPAQVSVRYDDPRLVELDAAESNPQDGMSMWYGPRLNCFTAATRFQEAFNRELVRLRPELAGDLCDKARR